MPGERSSRIKVVSVVIVVVESLSQIRDVRLVAPSLSQVLQQIFHNIVKLALKVLKNAWVVIFADVLFDQLALPLFSSLPLLNF